MGRHIYKIRVLKADRSCPNAECIEKLKKGQFIHAGVEKNPFKKEMALKCALLLRR